MTRILATSFFALVTATSAYAADPFDRGGSKDPIVNHVASEPAVNWSGVYIGGGVGYGIAQHDLKSVQTQHFNATPSSCWARGSWTSTNTPTTDPQNFPTLSNDFDLNFFKDQQGHQDVDAQLPAYPQNATDPDDRVHTVNAGASVTDVTEDECKELRKDLDLIDANGKDIYPNIATGYDPAIAAHDVTTSQRLKTSDSGLVGNVRLGYDQAMGRFLLGAFAEYGFSGLDGKDGEWSIGGRAGLIVAPRTLLYGLVAYTQADWEDVDFSGVTAGAGIEFAAASNLFLGLEYTHFFGGEEDLVNTPSLKVSDKLSEDKVMGRVTLKLNGDVFNK